MCYHLSKKGNKKHTENNGEKETGKGKTKNILSGYMLDKEGYRGKGVRIQTRILMLYFILQI